MRPIGAADLFFRAADVPLVSGNALRILSDAGENYPAWMDAIERASAFVHLEMYIVHNDRIGRRFRDLLVEKARQGVAVRVLYDAFGRLSLASLNFWKPLREAGAEIRVANPLGLDSVFAYPSRDHRKLLTVDGEVAFISGLCIGDDWVGYPERGIAPWRDTGVEIKGPAVKEADEAFAAAWKLWGDRTGIDRMSTRRLEPAGDVDLGVVPTSPDTASLYRLELLMTATTRKRLWLTDAYLMMTSTYMESLRAAARNGVDVRILVPGNSDVQWVANMSRMLYRRLLEGQIRVFEWNGPMLHAKSAVVDGRWTRIGSTNLNISSWIRNWELDVVIDSTSVAERMEAIYLSDLEHATEVVITERHRVRLGKPRQRPRRRRYASGSAARMLKDAAFMGTMVDAAVKSYRHLNQTESPALVTLALFFLGIATAIVIVPSVFAYPVAFLFAWAAITLLVKAWRLRTGK